MRGMGIVLATLLSSGAMAGPAWGAPWVQGSQAEGDFEFVPLRVVTERARGRLIVDRGTRDGLAVGDRVVLRPLEGGEYEASVLQVDDRNALVELVDRRVRLESGTRGDAVVPTQRFEEPSRGVPEIERPEGVVPVPEGSKWQRGDDGWRRGMSLLAKVEVLRPDQRQKRMTGRAYASQDMIRTSTPGGTDSLFRLGGDVLYENPLGYGGDLHLDGELLYQSTELDRGSDDEGSLLRIDRASYVWGNSRFSNERHEGGRFLQRGMPEFGVLDGYEWGRRLENGDRFGTSVGFMPEPDGDFESGRDFQLAAYYHWVADETERLSAAVGFQKTWHNSNPDRNLLVAKAAYLPIEGWNAHGTAWVDVYTSDDKQKDSGAELTQAWFGFGRRWEDGDSVDVTYSHNTFPDLDRNEFRPVLAQQLRDDFDERLVIRGSTWWKDDQRAHARLSGWFDEDDAGGELELGLEQHDWLVNDGLVDVSLFFNRAQFNLVYGARVNVGKFSSKGRWDVYYEVSNSDQDGFDANNDDIPAHRLRASHDFNTSSGWDLSVYADASVWDNDVGAAAGFFLHRSF